MDKSSPNGETQEKNPDGLPDYIILTSDVEDDDGYPLFVFEVIHTPEEL